MNKRQTARRREPVATSVSGALARTLSQSFCGRGSVVGISPDLRQVILIPVRCKAWDCPVCGPKRTRQVAAKIAAALPNKFITLTLKPRNGQSLESMFHEVKDAFTKLVKRIRREFGRFEYALVWELTKHGVPHAHIAAQSDYIPQKWLSRNWRELIASPVVDIRAVKRPGQIARYVSKYLIKNAAQTAAALDGRRLVQFSGHFLDSLPEFKPEQDYAGWDWSWCSHSIHDLLEASPGALYDYLWSYTPDAIYHLTCPPGLAPPPRFKFHLEGFDVTYGKIEIDDKLEDAWDQLTFFSTPDFYPRRDYYSAA